VCIDRRQQTAADHQRRPVDPARNMLTSFRFIVLLLACLLASVQCFVPASGRPTIEKYATWHGAGSSMSTSLLRMADEFVQESPEGESQIYVNTKASLFRYF
jgi:hypothetical protein